MEFKHVTVLLKEAVDSLEIKPGGIYVDGTAGGAGHSCEIAGRLRGGRLIALDRDKTAAETARERLKLFACAEAINANYAGLTGVLDKLGIDFIDGVLLDLGVSSHQLDTIERGFSYHYEAPLDMRMGLDTKSAHDIVNGYSIKDLTRILKEYGEEKFAYNIALNIEKHRRVKNIETTTELAEIIKDAIPAAVRRTGGHPAKKSFQAIRIEVNRELENLKIFLEDIFPRLNAGGRISVITFHSLEDRIVKNYFLNYTKGCECPPDFPICVCGKKPRARLVNKKPIVPAEEEIRENNRSRSAKLRTLEKEKGN